MDVSYCLLLRSMVIACTLMLVGIQQATGFGRMMCLLLRRTPSPSVPWALEFLSFICHILISRSPAHFLTSARAASSVLEGLDHLLTRTDATDALAGILMREDTPLAHPLYQTMGSDGTTMTTNLRGGAVVCFALLVGTMGALPTEVFDGAAIAVQHLYEKFGVPVASAWMQHALLTDVVDLGALVATPHVSVVSPLPFSRSSHAARVTLVGQLAPHAERGQWRKHRNALKQFGNNVRRVAAMTTARAGAGPTSA